MTGKEITYGRTPVGQLVYDLGFTKLSPEYLARKHGMPIAEVRRYRAAVLKGLAEGKKEERERRKGKA